MPSKKNVCLPSANLKIFLFYLGIGIGWANGEAICSAQINVGLALDGSSKMGQTHFASAIKFVANVSNYLTVETSKTWIFLAYGQQKRVFKTRSELVSLTPSNEPYPGTASVYLGATLAAIREEFNDEGAQRGAANVVFLIASHKSDDDIAVPTALLKASNATIFAMGVDNSYSEGQLKEIASDPNDEHFIRLSTWDEVNKDIAKTIAKKICQVVDSCVSSPCYNNGTCSSSEKGYSCTCPVEFYGKHCEKSRSVEYLSLGCYNDDAQVHAMQSLESQNATFLDKNYQTRENAIVKCALEAAMNGYSVFAVQNGACYSGIDAQSNYSMYGNTSCPAGGKGHYLVNEVYLLGAKCGKMVRNNLIHLSKSTVRGSSYNASWQIPLIEGDYSWCPNDSDERPYLDVDLGRKTYLTKLFVQGKKDAMYSADSICVNYTFDGQNFPGKSSCSVFEEHFSGKSGNYIHTCAMTPPLLVESVHLEPSANNNGGHCLRTELEGCMTTVTGGEEVTEGCYKTQRNKCCVFPFWYQGRQIYSCIKDNHNQPWCATTDSYDRDHLWDNCQGISSPCDTAPCLNGGTCIGNRENWSYKCLCSEYLSNENCEDDYDECFNSPCQNGGTCVNTYGGYSCECSHGYSGKNCHLDCSYNKVELGFVVDGSASVKLYQEGNFQRIKVFMKNLTRSFNVSIGQTRVGAIVYSTNSTLVFRLDQYSTYNEVADAIDNMSYPGGGTYTGKALSEASNSLFKSAIVRADARKVLVLITDGVSTDEVTQPTALLHNNGVLVFVVGIGKDTDYSQLLQIAHGQQDRVFSAEYNSLAVTANPIKGAICREIDRGCSDNPCRFNGVCQNGGLNCTCEAGFQGHRCSEDVKECTESVVSCGSGKSCTETFGGHECTCTDVTKYGENCDKDCSKGTTIMFLLDRSQNVGADNVKHQVEFVISVASTLSFKHIGVISYASDTDFVIRPGQPSQFSEFVGSLRSANYSMGKFKNLGAALVKSMEEPQLFDKSKVAVIIAMLAGKTEDEHAVPAALLQQKGVTIIALALGSSYSMSQLNLLVSRPSEDHILKSEFDDLKQFVSTTRKAICKAANPCSSARCSSSQICVNKYGQHAGFQCVTHGCSQDPCKNGGNCTIDGVSGYKCECPPGIGGKNCTEDVVNECDSAPCRHGGTCRDLLGHFRCDCPNDYLGRQCELACVSQKFNLVFVVDGSGSIEYQGRGNFQRSKDFIIEIVKSFNIGKDETNVALVLYSSNAQIVFNLKKYYRLDDIVRAIQRMPYPNGRTKTGKALEKVRKHVFKGLKGDRKNVPKVVMVLTDGLSHDDVSGPARKLRDAGATIISLGVGCCYDEDELKEMATDPDEKHVLEVSFSALNDFKDVVREQICSAVDFCSSHPCLNGGTCTGLPTDFVCDCPSGWQGKDCGTDVDECASQITQCTENQVCHNFPGGATCLCTGNRYGSNCTIQCPHTKFDVAFLLDSSGSINQARKENYQILKDFIKGIVKSFTIGENKTTVALATFSSLHRFKVRFNFMTYSAAPQVIAAIENVPYVGGQTYTADALTRLRTELFPLARPGVPHILIVLTDGRAHDNVTLPAQHLRDMGVHIISVGVGYVDYKELGEIATDPDNENVFTASFDSVVSLTGSILEDVCKAVGYCHGNPCKNNGTCRSTLNDYNCTCLSGFTGKSCDVEDFCRSQPCYNGGICSLLGNQYKCDCPTGLTGTNCELDVDECFNSPCLNGASSCKNTFGSYECNCSPGFTGINCQIGIQTNVFDVLLLFDGSSYLGSSHFRQSLLFAKAVLLNYNISREQTNVAAAVYASNVTISFNFTNFYSYSDVAAAIDQIPFLDDTPLNIEKALRVAKTNIFPTGRLNVPNVLVVFVSFSLSGNFAVISQALRDDGVKIIVIGIGSSFDTPQLEGVASTSDNVITTGYQHMDTVHGAVGGAVCQAVDPCASFPCQNGGNCSTKGSNYTCSCPIGFKGSNCEEDINECATGVTNCTGGKLCVNTRGGYQCVCPGGRYGMNCKYIMETKLDLAFLIDGSIVVTKENFLSFISFTKAFTATLNVSEENTHVSVAVYGDSPYLFANDSYNQSSLEQHFDSILYPGSLQSNLGEALLHVASTLYNKRDTRSNVTRVLVILTASKCHDDITVPSYLILNHYRVKVFVIAVGGHYSIGQVNEISSDPDSDYVHTVESGQNLSAAVVLFKDKLAQALDPCSRNPCRNGTCNSTGSGYDCKCYSGYSGINCDKVDGPCNPDPCKNFGTCRVLSLNSYYCACPTGWTGDNCDEDVKECSFPNNVCQNGGTCEEIAGDYHCNCALGYAGKNCDKVFNESMIDLVYMVDGSSSQHQIRHNMTEKIVEVIKFTLNYLPSPNTSVGVVLYAADAKTESYFNYTRNQTLQALNRLSHLPPGTLIGSSLNYTRDHLFNISRPNVHRVLVVFVNRTSNDAVSVPSNLLRDMNVTIIVVALGDWYDASQVNSTASNPHSATILLTTHAEIVSLRWRVHEMICEAADHCCRNPCANNGTCYNSLHGYHCSCPEGFTGSFCEEAIDYCELNNTCTAGQICISRNGTHDCVCPEGYYGEQCDKVEENSECGSFSCINGGTCINVGSSYRCNCSRGFYGRQCQFGCGFRELGLKVPSSRRIPDKDITASSKRTQGRSAFRGRIGVEAIGDWEDGWCSSPADTAPYFQVYFGYLTNVTAIETEGVTDGGTGMWVESYYVSTSNSSETASFVNYTEQGNTKIFKANDNINGKNVSLYGTKAHYLRIHPVTYKGTSACMRIALYGCDSEDFPSLGNVLQSVDDNQEDESSAFDTRYAVIPAVIFIALLIGGVIFFLRFHRKHSGKKTGYSAFDNEDDGFYDTIPYDMPMYEVQTVAIEMGPEKSSAVYGTGIWRETTYTQAQKYHNAIYEMDAEKTEYETQTLTLEVGKDAVARQVSYETSLASETTSLNGLSFETILPDETYESPFFSDMPTEVEEEEGIYEAVYQNLINEEDDEEGIYDNVFPESPPYDAKKMTLELAPQKTVVVENIFSQDNKIFGFDRVNTLPSRGNTLKRTGNTLPNGRTTLPSGISTLPSGRNTMKRIGNTLPTGRNTSKNRRK